VSDDAAHSDDLPGGWPDDVILGQEGAVRVFWLQSESMQGLVDRLALILSEHMATGDELHVTYNAMQAGWHEHPPRRGSVLRSPEDGWTELRFEYSTFVILRGARQ